MGDLLKPRRAPLAPGGGVDPRIVAPVPARPGARAGAPVVGSVEVTHALVSQRGIQRKVARPLLRRHARRQKVGKRRAHVDWWGGHVCPIPGPPRPHDEIVIAEAVDMGPDQLERVVHVFVNAVQLVEQVRLARKREREPHEVVRRLGVEGLGRRAELLFAGPVRVEASLCDVFVHLGVHGGTDGGGEGLFIVRDGKPGHFDKVVISMER